ncbi:MAG: sugar phosphate isomerase/epimerase [Planctomycetales bacterium]|nr:sugar phosphate isomerase/epimerase [Planctomycetales bacterium]
MRIAVTVSLVEEARGGPFVYWHDLPHACRRASELGFDAVEIFPPSPETLESAHARQHLADHGLALAAVGTGAGWVKHRLHLALPEATRRREARDFIRSIIDAAGAFGAPAIIGSMQGRSGDGVDAATARGYLAEALEELGEHARQYNVPLLYEPLNRYETNQVTTVADGVALLEGLSTTNVRLLCDLFHMQIEETDLASALRLGGRHVGHIHFVDSNRRPVGFGHMQFGPIITALRDIQYAGYLSAEAFPYPDSDSAAEQTILAYRYLTSLAHK